MRSILTRTIPTLAWPALIPVLAVLSWFRFGGAPQEMSQLLGVLPSLALCLALVLGWRFRRSRVVFAAGLVLVTLEALGWLHGRVQAADGRYLLAASSLEVLLPLNIGLLVWFRDRGVLTVYGLRYLLMVGVQGVALFLMLNYGFESLSGWLEVVWFEWAALGGLPLSQPALAAYGLAFVLIVLRFLRMRSSVESGFLGALIALFLAVTMPFGSPVAAIYQATLGFILVFSVLEVSFSLVYRDELTGLLARRALNETLDGLSGRYTIAMVDIDHFKRFNDRFGHDIGDQALKFVAGKLSCTGGGAKVFRYGGEEFALVFAGKAVADCEPHLEELRQLIAKSPFTIRRMLRPRKKPTGGTTRRKSEPRRVALTVSIGGADHSSKGTPMEIVKNADKALYRAKKAGRNRVVTA